MDDAPDREYSRAPELEDLVGLCRSLNREGARYLLIGGFAVILQGYVRATKDIDLLVDADPANVRALKRALAAGGGRDRRRLAGLCVRHLWSEAMASGVDYFDLEGVRVPVASKQLLIRTKDTGRPSDAADVAFLRLRIEADADA